MVNHSDDDIAKMSLSQARFWAKQSFDRIRLTQANLHGKYKYADLKEIKRATQPALFKYRLDVKQSIICVDGRDVIRTTVTKIDNGESDHADWPIATGVLNKHRDPSIPMTPQELGAAGTYARRYGFSAFFDIVTSSDDDGAQAQGYNNAQEKARRRVRQSPPIKESQQTTPAVTVPLTANGDPDWLGFFDDFIGQLGKANSNADIDILVKSCTGAFKNLKQHEDRLFLELSEKVTKKREEIKNVQP